MKEGTGGPVESQGTRCPGLDYSPLSRWLAFEYCLQHLALQNGHEK